MDEQKRTTTTTTASSSSSPILRQDFDPELSVNSGQTFLWEKVDRYWYGVDGPRIVRFFAKPNNDVDDNKEFEFASFPPGGQSGIERSLFRLDDDAGLLLREMSSRDPFLGQLVDTYRGLRLMRQNPEQCLFSFLCASNTNIPMIRRMLSALARKFGDAIEVEEEEEGGGGRSRRRRCFYAFPAAKALSRATEAELRSCGLGYRAKAVKLAADSMASGRLDLAALKKAGYSEAKAELLKVYGIGPKIADCILLFSLDKLQSFPIDVWIARALASHYPWFAAEVENKKKKLASGKLTARQYEELSGAARRHFGPCAGYAQQYLYYHMRQESGKKW